MNDATEWLVYGVDDFGHCGRIRIAGDYDRAWRDHSRLASIAKEGPHIARAECAKEPSQLGWSRIVLRDQQGS